MHEINSYQIKHAYINGHVIMYKLFVKPIKNSYIRVHKNNEIHVIVSKWMSQSTIDSFIQQNILKIHKHILNKKAKLIDPNLTYVHLLNEYYSIVIVFTNKRRKYEILGKKIYLHCQKTSDKQFLIRKLLLDYWNKTVPQMFRFWENKMNLFASLSVRWMTTKFGVCNVNAKKITLALQAICYSKEAINYLIVHELSHLVHPHHQKSFWAYVGRYIPNWKVLRKELNN